MPVLPLKRRRKSLPARGLRLTRAALAPTPTPKPQLHLSAFSRSRAPEQPHNLAHLDVGPAPYLPDSESPYDPLETSYDGTELTVDFSKYQGQSGTPSYRGYITLEQNPDLVPYKARGIYTDPGRYYLQSTNTPQVAAALDGPISAIISAPYRVEATQLPSWATPEDKEAQARHLEFCQRVFEWWGRNNFKRYLREVLRTAPISGFYLGELTAEMQGEHLYPRLPEYRAPWTVVRWIHQLDRLRGAEFSFSAIDSWGQRTPEDEQNSNRVIIPVEKLVHIAAGQVGSNYEGISWLRSVTTHIQMLQTTLQLWALAEEVNGVGTFIASTPDTEALQAKDMLEKLKEHLGNYAATDVPTVIMPPGWELDHKSPQQQVPDFTPHIIVLERMISMALKNSHSLIALQKAGSFAARADASAEARAGFKFIADEFINNPIESQIFERFLRINFPEDAAAGRIYTPQLVIDDPAVSDPKALIEATALAAERGLLEHPTYGPHFIKMLGLPMPEPAVDGTEAPNG